MPRDGAPADGRPPLEEEYSRFNDPGKWRIIGARADAWLVALADAGLADIELDAEVQWEVPPWTVVTRTDRAVPRAAGAIPLVVARSRRTPLTTPASHSAWAILRGH